MASLSIRLVLHFGFHQKIWYPMGIHPSPFGFDAPVEG